MTTLSFSAGLTLSADNTGMTEIEEVVEMSEVEQTNSETEVTHFGSTAKEFIATLGEGSDVDITCNRILTSNTMQQFLITAVANKSTVDFELAMNDGTNTETLSFSLAMKKKGWTPSMEDANRIVFSGRITGAVTSAIT